LEAMETMVRAKMVKFILALGMAAAIVPAIPQSASADVAYTCPQYVTFSHNGSVVAKLCWSTTNPSTATLTLQSLAPYRGVTKYMLLKVCKVAADGSKYDCSQDAGDYQYYAGPISDANYGSAFHYKAVMYDGNGNEIVHKTGDTFD
jgi:hypothetical protein